MRKTRESERQDKGYKGYKDVDVAVDVPVDVDGGDVDVDWTWMWMQLWNLLKVAVLNIEF